MMKNIIRLGRSAGIVTLLAIAVSGCATMKAPSPAAKPLAFYAQTYAAMPQEMFTLPAINITKVKPRFLRQVVNYDTPERVGTIIVDPANRHLYLVMEGGKAMRYGIGVGRAGFDWNGRAYVGWKRAWPTWTPPREMVQREPKLVKYADGMPPSLANPLGARAIYIFQNGKDTLYRFHGTNEPWTIGKAVSSGCIRMFNQDVIDLYDRIPKRGTEVVVLTAA